MNKLIVELRHYDFVSVDGYSDIVRQDISLVGFVTNFGDYIVADTETVNVNFTVSVSHKFFGVMITADVSAFYLKGEAFNHAIFRSLFDSNAAGLRIIDKADPGLIFNGIHLAIILDGIQRKRRYPE